MLSEWTRHLKDQKDKSDFEDQIKSYRPVLERLQQLIEAKAKTLEVAEYSVKDFDTPNWEVKHAWRVGGRAFAHYVTQLLNLDQKESK